MHKKIRCFICFPWWISSKFRSTSDYRCQNDFFVELNIQHRSSLAEKKCTFPFCFRSHSNPCISFSSTVIYQEQAARTVFEKQYAARCFSKTSRAYCFKDFWEKNVSAEKNFVKKLNFGFFDLMKYCWNSIQNAYLLHSANQGLESVWKFATV